MSNRAEIGAFILRVLLGATFFIHGVDKLQAGLENIAAYFDSIGLPGFLAYVVGIVELIGGIALILGIGTQAAAALIAVILVGAISFAKLPAGFLGSGTGAGYELDLALLAIAIYFAIGNRSKLALDNLLFPPSNKQIRS